MRSYGQYCSVAKALDVIGDRWTLLIVRELLVRGACRYTDLKNGLPGIATNLLADRIRELESAGLVRREEAPPPVATTLVQLTEAGGGLRYMGGAADPDEFRSQWFASPVDFFLRDRDPGGPPASIELRTGADPAVIEVSGGQVRFLAGAVPRPDLVLAGPPQLIDALLTGQLTADEVTAHGLQVTGDAALLDRVLPGKEDGYHGQPQPAANGGKP